MRADYARNHEETLATISRVVSFFKEFEEIEGDFRFFVSNPGENSVKLFKVAL
jgi:hypothetical protein